MNVYCYEGLTVEEPYYSYWSIYTELLYKELKLDELLGYVYVEFVGDLPGGLYGSTHPTDHGEIEIEIAMFQSNGDPIPFPEIQATVAHEMVHAAQYLTGDLVQHGLIETTQGLHFKYTYKDMEYINPPFETRPWEIEASIKESMLVEIVNYKMRFGNGD